MIKGGEHVIKKISFIHAADLHLDSPFKGLANVPEKIFQEIQASTFVALDRMVAAAIDREVDFILLVGDLFDNEKQSLKAQIRLRKAFEELNKHGINVYLSYGNHDHISGNIHPVTYPNNVYIFKTEQVNQFIYEKNGQQLATIQGFSYENRAVTENKTHAYQINDPEIPFHLAMLHGSIQNNTDHDMYAPFKLSELIEKDFNYWALGHIHQRQILRNNPFIVYPGNTQGRHKNETGEKGCYYVELTETTSHMTFIPLQAIQFRNMTIDVSMCNEVHELEDKIHSEINQHKAIMPQLIELNLMSNHHNLKNWKINFDLEELVELVNDASLNKTNWCYIYRLTFTDLIPEINELPYEGGHFIGELSRQFNQQPTENYLNELFNHRQGRKYLEKYSKTKEDQLKAEARQMLLNELLNDGGDFY